MSRPIVRLYLLVIVLFGALIFATSWWTVFGAKGLEHNVANRRSLIEEARVPRGLIRADDGTVLARSVKGPAGTYHRIYPTGGLFAQTIGYSYISLGRAGLEESRNDPLTGKGAAIASIVDQLAGKQPKGDDVQTTLDPQAQRVALDGLANAEGIHRGAVVALDPSTGAVKVMASLPGFDPNSLQQRGRLGQLNHEGSSPVFNRATQSSYPPGSSFKVVTALAAIDSGRYTPTSTVSGKNDKLISGVPLRNDGGQDFGDIDLTKALTFSVNTVWAEVAEKLGKKTMAQYMTRLGFYSKPPLDYPGRQRAASGEYDRGRLLDPLSSKIDVGRMGIGQDRLAVTPLQMAMVASAVANDGVLVKPHMTKRIVDQDGREVQSIDPSVQARVVSKDTADKVAQMMSQVVKEGTGTAAALSGVEVAGKTGTAEVNVKQNITQPWFIAFAPINKPKVAIAVTVEKTNGGFGGTVAAPIAKSVLESLLR